MRTHYLPFLILGLIACGDDGGGGGNNPDASTNPDGPAGGDASVDGPTAPAMITISGRATAQSLNGAEAVADVTIGAYRSSDESTPIATTMSDNTGNFTLTITTGGEALVGYLRGAKAGHVVTYLYAPAPIAEDTAMVPMNMLTTVTYDLLYTITQTTKAATGGTVAVVVTDAATMPVGGATIATTPATAIKYNGANGFPSSTAMSTHTDGVAFGLNAPLGAVTITADKAGSTFQPNTVKVFQDSLTTTLIVPQ